MASVKVVVGQLPTVTVLDHDLRYVLAALLVFVLSRAVVGTQTISPVITTALNLQRAALDNYVVAGGWDGGTINQRNGGEGQHANGRNGYNQ